MAKSDQLMKWIASKEATIAKKQETISKRAARIEKLKQEFVKQGIHVTDDDLRDNPYNAWRRLGFNESHPLFDKFYSMHDASEQNLSSEKDIRFLQRDLEQNRHELATLQDKTQAAADKYDNELENKLTEAFQPFYQEYLQSMKSYHEKKWQHYWNMQDEWRTRKKELGSTRSANYLEYNRKTEEISKLNKLLSDPSLKYDKVEDYINKYVIPYLNEYWKSSIKVLVNKCADFNINKQLLKVSKPQMTDKGFEVVITDGGARQIYARLIWAAEDSLYVTPHFRYIVTERH